MLKSNRLSSIQLRWGSKTYRSLSSWISDVGQDENSFDENPKFANRSLEDYRLSPDSNAIDAGCDISFEETLYDLDGIERPQDTVYGIGAYEHHPLYLNEAVN